MTRAFFAGVRALALIALVAAAGCAHAAAAAAAPDDAAVAALGKQLFSDPALSASGRLSCATCHAPGSAYAPPNGRAVQAGGAHLDRTGLRAAPSLRYTLNRTPVWYHEHAASALENLTEQEPPAGGFGWDGRFDRLRDQAAFPLLDPHEMANADAAAVLAAVARGPEAAPLRHVFGDGLLRDAKSALAAIGLALERFELTDASFHPFTSKYDAYLDGAATLSPQEVHGKRLFDDPRKGGCALCHIDASGANGAHPVFTDFQFEALGVPRNGEIPANRDAHYADLGLCGPLRTDQHAMATYCGLFKTPTLRNVATRRAFFHNGRFHTLRDALRFYVARDTDPQKWYPRRRDGRVVKFDDVPARYRGNVDVSDPPLASERGRVPVWSESEINDVIAYLKTLDDGYSKVAHDGGVSAVTGVRR